MIGRGHFGGRLVFAPDGKLFITSGDRQRFEPAQDLGSNVGKIVRINPDGSIPEDNPFVGKDGVLPERERPIACVDRRLAVLCPTSIRGHVLGA